MEKKKKKILKGLLLIATVGTLGVVSYIYGPKVYRKYCKRGDAQQSEPAQAQKPEPPQMPEPKPAPEQNIQKKAGWKPRYNNKQYND